jgi:hypothetical protein
MVRKLIAMVALGMLAACQQAAPIAPPVTVAPPPPSIPRAPTPPFSASATFVVPALRADGLRQTINRDIGPLQTLWHVRSALNVAALACSGPAYGRIADDYNAFIGNNAKELSNANNAVLRKYQREHGSGYRSVYDRHLTELYNYFSFSPLRRPFCDVALQVGQTAALTRGAANLNAMAATALLELEKPFNDFYLAYEQYQRDLATWNAQYGPKP